MKNKPLKHKETNRFKFQSFADRINEIDVRRNALYHLDHANIDCEEDNETRFYKAIQKWNVLNLTEGYSNFRKEVQGIITLPQLLHKKEQVVEALLKHLKIANVLCLQPLLEIVVVFAKDLREDFYPYFQRFLDQLILLLNTKDSEQLEWTLICLAYLFKTLRVFLKREISVVFKSVLPLLDDSKAEYINNFAAESFAFVARDIKDKNKFLALILQTLKHQRNGVAGCGRLLFEIVRGVSGQFHSCASSVLSMLFESLGVENLRKTDLFEVLTYTVNDTLTNIGYKNILPFWESAIGCLNIFLSKWQKDKSEATILGIENLLKLMGQGVEFKAGKYLVNPTPITLIIIKIINMELPVQILEVTSQICGILLLSPNILLPQEEASRMTASILKIQHSNVLLNFVQNVSTYPQFEVLILPHFLKYCINFYNDECLFILTKICTSKVPISKNGVNLDKWRKYQIDFGLHSKKMHNILINNINMQSIDEVLKCMDTLLCSLICIPHIKDFNARSVRKILSDLIHILVKGIGNIEEVNDAEEKKMDNIKRNRNMLFVLTTVLETAIHLEPEEIKEIFNINVIVESLLKYANDVTYLSALNGIDLALTASSIDLNTVNLDMFHKLQPVLSENLCSPFHEIRLVTCHILTLFNYLPEFNNSTLTVAQPSIFTLMYNTEGIPPSIKEYREQIQNMKKIHAESLIITNLNERYSKLPLKYLMGILYVNFKLLWGPTLEIMASYSQLNATEFWNIFLKQLHFSEYNIKNKTEIIEASEGFESSTTFLLDIYCSYYNVENKPDFINYRMFLWQSMSHFPDLCEARNRDLVNLFLNFMEDEYMKSDNEDAMQNVADDAMEVDEESDKEEEEDNEQDNKTEKSKLKGKALKRARTKPNHKTLLAQLAVFARIKSPKTVYREEELYKLYLEFLLSKNSKIQSVALDCIMCYKEKYLIPYKQNLYNLIDDNKFKNEMTSFQINKESDTIKKEHRKNLIPIILRILFAKMVAKVGTNSKGGGQYRRSLVIRYLAGCHEEELMMFTSMAFKTLSDYSTDENPVAMCERVISETNLEKAIAPKRLLSSINLVEVVREEFGYLGNNFLKYLTYKVLTIGSVTSVLLEQQDINTGYSKIIKNVRILCIQYLSKFFSQFDTYPWTQLEMDAIFNIFIWPSLNKLSAEGIHTPTALLKLFLVWSSNPRYYILLAKHHKADKSLTPLLHIMKLLVGPKTKPAVTTAILQMVENMLTLEIEEDAESTPIILDDVIEIDQAKMKTMTINYGSCLLLPFITDVLEIIKRKVAGSAKRKTVGRRELLILSRATELVSEPETCNTLLKLLLPILVKRGMNAGDEETVMHLVVTVNNLLQNVEDPASHIKSIAPLFEVLTGVAPRKMLCKILETVYTKSKLDQKHLVINELNAYDAKWIEQPDYERRLSAFKQIDTMTLNNEIDLDLGVLIIYNCFYIIRSEKDLSLKDSAGHYLRKLIPVLAVKYQSNPKEREFLISTTILQLIRNCIRNKDDVVRNEAISLLGEMVRECPDVHPVLRDLAPLGNKVDREVDFFDNLTHLQTHRKVRALLKFCTVCKEIVKTPGSRTLTQFILPLASMFLCSEKDTGKNSLIDASIDTVATVCRLLPWHQYETILKFYLGKLRSTTDFQKQLVRIVVAILDSFHFDLSKAKIAKVDDVVKTIESVKAEETKSEEPSLDETEKVDETSELYLDEVLDDVNESAEKDPIVEPEVITKAMDRQMILAHSAAKRLIHSITTGLLPQLNRAISQMTSHEGSHKLNRKKTGAEREEEDILKVPIALAVVKLLQKLPKGMLEYNLPGVFMKICTFLKSPLRGVRSVTRDILKKIMTALGPDYLETLLEQLTSLLTRGFHVHVLIATVHDVLEVLKDTFKTGDMDKNLQSVLTVCKEDLYGNAAEEKAVDKLGHRTPEAKPSRKTFSTLQIAAQNITDQCFVDLLLPFKEVLSTSHSKKMILKTQECFTNIVAGLVNNKFVSVESLLMFSYGTSSESIPELITGLPKRILTDKEKERIQRAKPDCFIIPEAPRGRAGVIRKVVISNAQTNAHVLVEFGLALLKHILKEEKLRGGDYRPFLDPLVPILNDALKSSHIKITTLSLKCIFFIWTFKINLPNMHATVNEMSSVIFNMLHKYATAGLSKKNDNFFLVMNGFKTMTALIRHVKYHTIDKDQLVSLLLYAEQDIQDSERQATAFSLLKAIISAELIVPEMHDVMNKVAKLSIVSELPRVREESRMVLQSFLMNYPLGPKLERHIQFYLTQLCYEMQPGRESAIKMVNSMIQKFPVSVLGKHCGLFLLSLGPRLVNDESAECRKLIAECIEALLERLPASNKETLFEIVLVLFKDKKTCHKEMAAQLCSRFVVVEKLSFKSRLNSVLPIIVDQISTNDNQTTGKFVKIVNVNEVSKENDKESIAKQRAKDHHYIQLLNMTLKIFEHCPFVLKHSTYNTYIDDIAIYSQKLLGHPHVWLRLEAAKILEYLLREYESQLIFYKSRQALRSLILDFCAQLIPGEVNTEFAEQVSQNLIYIANILKDVKVEDASDTDSDNKPITLSWLIRRIRYVVNSETAKSADDVLRTAVFNWISGIITLLEPEQLILYAQQLLPPLIREMSNMDESNTKLRQHANKVAKRMKNKIGDEEFSRLRQVAQTRLSVKRADRKKVKAQEKINDPVKAAKRKLTAQQKKKALKKRRMEEMKGKKPITRKRSRKEANLEDD